MKRCKHFNLICTLLIRTQFLKIQFQRQLLQSWSHQLFQLLSSDFSNFIIFDQHSKYFHLQLHPLISNHKSLC